MQKRTWRRLIGEELVRAGVFGVAFFLIVVAGIVGVANAANGGFFGDVLNKILFSGDWNNPGDGTVKNASQLGGQDASNFLKLGVNKSCAAPQCIYGFDAVGNVLCH